MAGKNSERPGRLKPRGKAFPHSTEPLPSTLQTFQNKFKNRRYWIRLECPELAFVSRGTGEQESAKLIIKYVPAKRCLERGSLELYLTSYQHRERSNEEMLNLILQDFVSACRPSEAMIHGEFTGRGGTEVFDASFPAGPVSAGDDHQMISTHQQSGQRRSKRQ